MYPNWNDADNIELCPLLHLRILLVLEVLQPVFHHIFILHGPDDYPVLDTFLEVALDLALGIADSSSHSAETAVEDLAETDENRGDNKQNQSQTPVHGAHENKGCSQLEQG